MLMPRHCFQQVMPSPRPLPTAMPCPASSHEPAPVKATASQLCLPAPAVFSTHCLPPDTLPACLGLAVLRPACHATHHSPLPTVLGSPLTAQAQCPCHCLGKSTECPAPCKMPDGDETTQVLRIEGKVLGHAAGLEAHMSECPPTHVSPRPGHWE